jgi:uncharacterized damage-inducible protein DinB
MSTATTDRQAEALAKLISPGGALEQQVQHLAEVLHIWRTAPLPERRFLCVDHQAAEEILALLHRLQQPGGRA